MPIGTRRFGRLGNEIYQYAAVISYARKHGLEYSLPSATNDETWNPCHFRHLAHPNWVEGREDILINEYQHEYQEIEFREEWRDKQIVLNGYWQSYKYFDFCKEELLKIFDFPYEMNGGYCSVHVRRGDFLLHPTKHPVVTGWYLFQAMMHVYVKAGAVKFMVFSDDIEWCKQEFNDNVYSYFKFEYSEGRTEIEDLILMSNCEHNICSNSTMSTWATELNKNENKIIIVPSKDNWFGPNNKQLSVEDMYRPEWVQIAY